MNDFQICQWDSTSLSTFSIVTIGRSWSEILPDWRAWRWKSVLHLESRHGSVKKIHSESKFIVREDLTMLDSQIASSTNWTNQAKWSRCRFLMLNIFSCFCFWIQCSIQERFDSERTRKRFCPRLAHLRKLPSSTNVCNSCYWVPKASLQVGWMGKSSCKKLGPLQPEHGHVANVSKQLWLLRTIQLTLVRHPLCRSRCSKCRWAPKSIFESQKEGLHQFPETVVLRLSTASFFKGQPRRLRRSWTLFDHWSSSRKGSTTEMSL